MRSISAKKEAKEQKTSWNQFEDRSMKLETLIKNQAKQIGMLKAKQEKETRSHAKEIGMLKANQAKQNKEIGMHRSTLELQDEEINDLRASLAAAHSRISELVLRDADFPRSGEREDSMEYERFARTRGKRDPRCAACDAVVRNTTHQKSHVGNVHLNIQYICPIDGCRRKTAYIHQHIMEAHKLRIKNLSAQERTRYKASVDELTERVRPVMDRFFVPYGMER